MLLRTNMCGEVFDIYRFIDKLNSRSHRRHNCVVAAAAQRHDTDRGVAVHPVGPWPTPKFGWVGPATKLPQSNGPQQ